MLIDGSFILLPFSLFRDRDECLDDFLTDDDLDFLLDLDFDSDFDRDRVLDLDDFLCFRGGGESDESESSSESSSLSSLPDSLSDAADPDRLLCLLFRWLLFRCR